MAGGTFKLSQPKVRPGVYVNVTSKRQSSAGKSLNGVAMIPLIGYDYGPREEWIHLTSDSPDAEKAKLGRSIYDDNEYMRMLALMFQNAVEVYVYICGAGTAAKGDMVVADGTSAVTAAYAGTLGNSIQLVSVSNPTGGFDVSVLLDGAEVELFEAATTVGDLATSAYITITADDSAKELAEFASLNLAGGEDDTTTANSSFAKFLDAAEKIRFNCMAVPTEDESLITAAITKIKYIRNTIGWKCQAVVVDTAADHEGIYNLTNSFVYDGVKLPKTAATAWLAGAVAGADYVSTLTYKVVTDATGVVDEKNNEAAELSIKKGETFFTVDENGEVILEYDINSKVTFANDDPVSVNKGRPCRVYDTLANELLLTFVPGKYDNSETGWSVIEGLGKAILKAYADDGAITDVDADSDFVVDRTASSGDSVYINVGVQAIDSAEKYYFTVVAR